MRDHERSLLAEVAQLADDLGPALVPAGHIELLDSIAEAAMQLFEAAACSLALLDGEELVYHGAAGAGEGTLEGMRTPADEGIAGWVVTSGQAIAVDDVADDERFAPVLSRQMGYTPRTVLAIPLETDRGMIGAIAVLDREPLGITGHRDMELLSLFARQAALAVEVSNVFNRLGRALFQAVGEAAEDGELSTALARVAEDTTGPDPELAQVVERFHELSLAGPRERRVAAGVLREVLAYAPKPIGP